MLSTEVVAKYCGEKKCKSKKLKKKKEIIKPDKGTSHVESYRRELRKKNWKRLCKKLTEKRMEQAIVQKKYVTKKSW